MSKPLPKKLKGDFENNSSELSNPQEEPLTIGRGRGRGESSTDSSSTSGSRRKIKETESEKSSIPSELRKDGREQWLASNKPIYTTRPEHITCKKTDGGQNENELYANYFRIGIPQNFEFAQYRVDFSPDIDMIKLRRYLVAKCSNKIRGYVYDGGNLVYLTRRLPQDSIVIPIKQQNQYDVKFKFTNVTIKSTDLTAMMVLNCILRNAMRGLNLKLIQRNLYDEPAKILINEYRLELWPGYETSIRQHERDILVCCEISHKVMRFDTVYSILQSKEHDRVPEIRTAFSKEIIGTVVLTRYNNRTYRIDDVRFDLNPKSTFKAGDKEISFIEYYKTRYNLIINDPKQPLLVSNPKARDIRDGRNEPVLLIPELCFTTGLTDSMRSDFNVMKRLGEYTRMDPTKRVERLEEFSRRMNQTEGCFQKLESFGVNLDRQLLRVSGRILKQEQILFGQGRSNQNDFKADWTQGIRNPMYTNVALQRWGIIYPSRSERDFNEFMKIFEEVARGQNFEMGAPKYSVINDDRPRTYADALESFCARDPKFVMVILPNNNAERYKIVKTITYVNRGIPSQVIVQRTIQPKKGSMAGVKSIATKILIQINAKLGGVPWMINIPLSGLMTIGFDVSHDTNDKSKSYGAFVASMDLKLKVSFFSTVSEHRNGEECSNNIGVHMQKALMAWREENGSFPERILFYRDGVGDGQIQYVHEIEVRKIKDVLRGCYGDKFPKFAFVVVSKRINTRIFNKTGGRRYENPVSGTVVDDDVTLPERYDFFLISQSVRQGTVSPTSYNIIDDSFGLPPERMQMLTYKMCHLYYNWSGTTRVPAVVQYAHKLSVLVGQFLHITPNLNLDKSLYYL
ncbi:hypothetical protein ACKWTF_002125 [Chironomus riparius]